MKTASKSSVQGKVLSNLYQDLLFSVLRSMPRGRLSILDKNGRETHFGEGNGTEARITVHRADFYRKTVLYGDVGFGESYVDGDWDTEDIQTVISWFLENLEHNPTISGSRKKNYFLSALNGVNKLVHKFRDNTLSGSRKNIQAHYDASNDFFASFLDPSMTYSCAYFKHPNQSLEEAQKEKYDQLCKKLRIKASDHVLEIGSGWGGFAIHAAKTYGCHVTTLTISKEQFSFALERIRQAGLSDKIEIKMMDYRHLRGAYDKIVSIEMLEAVGDKYFETYFAKCSEVLKPHGLMGFQIITCPDSRYDQVKRGVDWIQKHIFPGSLLPSLARIQDAVRKTGTLQMHGLEDMGHFYVETLSRWHETFNRNLDRVTELGFDRAAARKWNYYFKYCQAAFRSRNISVLQAVFTRPNNPTLAH